MKNIFKKLFSKGKKRKTHHQPQTHSPPSTSHDPPHEFDKHMEMLYGPPPTMYAPPAIDVLTLIPGKLSVLNGPDKGKSFRLAGIKTTNGITVTVGRYTDSWRNYKTPEQQKWPILINDPSHTFSKVQFEITYHQGEISLKSLSERKPTVVDGEILQCKQFTKIRAGSLITAGNVKLRYDG